MSDRFPHTCVKCKSPAYIGFNTTECSNQRCPEPAVSDDRDDRMFQLAQAYLNGVMPKYVMTTNLGPSTLTYTGPVTGRTTNTPTPVAVGQKYIDINGATWQVLGLSLAPAGWVLSDAMFNIVIPESDLQDPTKWTLLPSQGAGQAVGTPTP